MNAEQTAPDGLHMAVGRLEGRLGALEERTGRNEAEVRDKLNGMDGKLDAILATNAERVGFKAGSLWVFGAALTATGAASAWFFGLLRGHGG
jgi:hypothetical protein